MSVKFENIRRLAIFSEDERFGLRVAVRTGFASSGDDGKSRCIESR